MTKVFRMQYALTAAAAVCAVQLCLAQAPRPDAEGCKDSPLVGRFPGSVITSCKDVADDAFSFTMASGKPNKRLEGEMHVLSYDFPKTASKAQVVRNLNTAMRNAGYTFDYDSGDYGDFTVHRGKTWIQIEISGGGSYRETIVTETQLTQDVVATAAALSAGLTSNGHMVIPGILFDTGKSDVKPESAQALEQIVALMKQDAKLRVFVVGHTDNVGGLAANLDLSRRRAAAVVQVLASKYAVAADRLDAFGAGPYAPMASNDSEDGRALNRRVELVKQ
jgi:OOP family OmpA-OmpF porin